MNERNPIPECLSHLRQLAPKWQPIETAAPGIESALLWDGRDVFEGWHCPDSRAWFMDGGAICVPQPTKWMPMPGPPA